MEDADNGEREAENDPLTTAYYAEDDEKEEGRAGSKKKGRAKKACKGSSSARDGKSTGPAEAVHVSEEPEKRLPKTGKDGNGGKGERARKKGERKEQVTVTVESAVPEDTSVETGAKVIVGRGREAIKSNDKAKREEDEKGGSSSGPGRGAGTTKRLVKPRPAYKGAGG